MRAAEYVRMSTDHQHYSIANQQTAIAEYAALHGFELVRTYADPARSGLDIAHRPGLQRLIDDVTGGRADYQAVLVYDVSRWGRFQDTDEAACYEFLCKRAGIYIYYCAEPFQNDGSMASAFLKMVKRTMAAEYLRELSVKVHAGQCRIAAQGFRIGGHSLYGLRRAIVGADGKPKTVLADGEWKSRTTERVTYVLGPEHEVAVIRKIYSMFLDDGMGITKIGRALSEQGLNRGGEYGPWIYSEVHRVLTHPAYAGCATYNRTARKLKGKNVRNSRDKWILCPNAFPAIVSMGEFDRAQQKLASFVHRRSNERLLAELKVYLHAHGTGLSYRNRPRGMASAQTYRQRFGGWLAAYERVGFQTSRFTPQAMAKRKEVVVLKLEAMKQLKEAFVDSGFRCSERYMELKVRGLGRIVLKAGLHYVTPKSQQCQWRVKTIRVPRNVRVIIARLKPGNSDVQDFVVLHQAPTARSCFTLNQKSTGEMGTTLLDPHSVVRKLLSSR